MRTFAGAVVARRGTTDPDAPLVVLLHGRGSNEEDIIGLADHLPEGPGYAAVRAPTAEGGGYAWFANRGIGRPVAESLAGDAGSVTTAVHDVGGHGLSTTAHGQLLPRDAFDSWAGPRGALFAGSPQEIHRQDPLGARVPRTRSLPRQIGLGGHPFAETADSIELLATEVLTVVRRETSAREKQPA